MVLAQADKLNVGQNFMNANLQALQLVDSDISDIIVSDMYTTKHNGVTHIYYQQQHDGVPVHSAILNVSLLPNNDVLHHNSTFVSNLASKINTTKAKLSPEEAILYVAKKINVINPEIPTALKRNEDGLSVFAETSYSNGPIQVKPMYQSIDGQVKLSWDVYLDDARSNDLWSIRIDASNGEVLDQANYTVYCQHHPGAYHNHNAECKADHEATVDTKLTSFLMGDSYAVYELPIESPVHGPQTLVVDPAIPEASPFGWHDLDGIEGAETTITRGNNVHAYQDEDNDNTSALDEPDGGADLIFDFPHDQDSEPEASVDADVVNLFYMNNMMHDISYVLGFDEVSGNFQNNTYGNGGRGADEVVAHALDGSGVNNASFGTPLDGGNGNMNMFRWDLPTAGLFSISGPSDVAGFYPNGQVGAGWGFDATYAGVDIEAEIAFAQDADPQFPDNVCNDVVNVDEVEGKVAFIYRGLCEFGTKALNAQNAGAIAVVICNVPGAGGDPSSDGSDPISGGLGGGADGGLVTIPTLALGFQDCNTFRGLVEGGTPVVAVIRPSEAQNIDQVSSGFDNGVIAHEYAHGISFRLVGGPNTNCLGTDEQMGEGWSDFFGLITTVSPDDLGTDPRGIGNYVDGRGVDGKGIRRFPYSTDLNVNPQTFKDIKATTAPHPLGEVWVDMIWDMFWMMIDEYGFDEDWTNTQSGNHIAAKLVMDGMRLMGCNAGFIPGRNAILAADRANNGGANECIIWEAFARRGLGFFANGGSVNNRNDGEENFDVMPSCIRTLKIRKDIASLIETDTETEVTLFVSNHTDSMQTSVVVSDLIPDGLSYVDNTSSIPSSILNDQIIFEIGEMAIDEEQTITYRLQADGSLSSNTLTSNAVETSQELSEWQRTIGTGTNLWQTINSSIFPTFSGDQAWFVSEIDEDTEQVIIFPNIEVSGDIPVVRFWHRINTEFARNGGFVEISNDGVLWFDARDDFIRNGPNCPLQFTTFAIPGLQAFSGENNNYTDSWINLTPWRGQTISLRFRFGTNTAGTPGDETFAADAGWFIDDLDLLDLAQLDTQACVNADSGQACTPFETTIINTDALSTSTEDLGIEGVEVTVFPNPASDYYTMKVMSENNFDANISLLSIDGQIIKNQNISITAGENQITTNTSTLPSGFYIAQLRSGSNIVNHKIFVD